MKLIVGLGNPEKKYENTRHNCWFMAVDFYNVKYNLTEKTKFNGIYTENTINNEKIILLKPQTYMNLSGNCVTQFVNYFNINIKDIYVIYDDVDFEVGSFKIKRNGSSGGHNGIKSIINCLKTQDIKRIRIGISKNDIPLEDYVLQRFSKEDLEKVNNLLPTISNIIDEICVCNIDELMEKYNRNNNE